MKIQTFSLFISTVNEKYKRLESHPRLLAIFFSKNNRKKQTVDKFILTIK
jgi:hypothetical protein